MGILFFVASRLNYKSVIILFIVGLIVYFGFIFISTYIPFLESRLNVDDHSSEERIYTWSHLITEVFRCSVVGLEIPIHIIYF